MTFQPNGSSPPGTETSEPRPDVVPTAAATFPGPRDGTARERAGTVSSEGGT